MGLEGKCRVQSGCVSEKERENKYERSKGKHVFAQLREQGEKYVNICHVCVFSLAFVLLGIGNRETWR